MSKFESKNSIGDLIEYVQDRNDEQKRYGFIVEVTFWKSDAVNFTCAYAVQKTNSDEIDRGIYETNVHYNFGPKGVK